MAGPLSLNTEVASSKPSQQQQPLATNRASAPATSSTSSSSSSNPPIRHLQSTTPIPVPLPITSSFSREQQQQQPPPPPPPQPQPQPQLQLQLQQQQSQNHSRSSSPTRPTYSPITPPLKPTAFPPRPTYTHSSHVDAIAAPAPAPEPIDFDSNPDVLALKSAISILQMQRRKAERDMATLDRVKRTALAQPEAFVRDLTTGRIRVEGEGLFTGTTSAASAGGEKDSDSSSDSDDDDSEAGNKSNQRNSQETGSTEPNPGTRRVETSSSSTKAAAASSQQQQWVSIPKPQNIVRCPPINWSQYAVVGESLDKLHNEQVQRPSQGVPAAMTPDGRFEFKGGGSEGKQERYLGVAAPYAPGKDKIVDGKSSTTPLKR